MIGIGSDHNGSELKQRLLAHLAERGEDVWDFGSSSDEPVDYPDIAAAVAGALHAGLIERGILVCRSGLGMAIAAGKTPGVYAVPVTDTFTARLARERNNASIITLGAAVVGPGRACAIVDAWLDAAFRGGESARKIEKIRVLERQQLAAAQAAGGGVRWLRSLRFYWRTWSDRFRSAISLCAQ
jgi:ribose 5-phosphate isomerase B